VVEILRFFKNRRASDHGFHGWAWVIAEQGFVSAGDGARAADNGFVVALNGFVVA
jgi:hypothetical protein